MPTTSNALIPKKTDSPKKTNGLTDDTIRGLAFDNSLCPNIITIVSTGKIIIANMAACKLLGYSKKELLTKSRASIFDIKESNFKNMLKQRTAVGHSNALVTGIKKSGTHFLCEITSAVFNDEDGIKKAITTIEDMSQSIRKQKSIDSKKEKIIAKDIIVAQLKSDTRIEKNNEWIKYIAKTSYDVMWDWNIATGEIYVGDSVEEVFGYKVLNNSVNFTEFIKYLLPNEKKSIENKLSKKLASKAKSWKASYKFIRHDKSIASTVSRASIIRDEKGNAVHLIGNIQDISKLQEMEKKLLDQIVVQEELGEKYLIAAKLSFDGIWDWNLLTNDFFLGEGFEDLFGVAKDKIGSDWSKYLHPDDKDIVEKGLDDAITSSAESWEQAYRFIKPDGSTAKVFCRASIIRNAEGKAIHIIGAVHDINKQKVLEEMLEQEIKLKETQITQATDEAKEQERSDLGKELHDNINQLLSASKLYLDMGKKGGADSGLMLTRSSEYTMTAIEEIRKLTKGLTTDAIKNIGLCESIKNLISDTMEVNPLKLSFVSGPTFIEDDLNDKFKLNIFRIIQEQLTNIIKHAKAKKVVIAISKNAKSILLFISDNGIGFDTGKKRKGIGVDNIKSRALSYKGIAEFNSKPKEGCILTVTFPLTDILLG